MMSEQRISDLRLGEIGCAKCGSSMMWIECWSCGGDGEHELYDEDPLWYDEDDTEECDICDGAGGWKACMSCQPGAFDNE